MAGFLSQMMLNKTVKTPTLSEESQLDEEPLLHSFNDCLHRGKEMAALMLTRRGFDLPETKTETLLTTATTPIYHQQ